MVSEPWDDRQEQSLRLESSDLEVAKAHAPVLRLNNDIDKAAIHCCHRVPLLSVVCGDNALALVRTMVRIKMSVPVMIFHHGHCRLSQSQAAE
jgi:hypothetical protein